MIIAIITRAIEQATAQDKKWIAELLKNIAEKDVELARLRQKCIDNIRATADLRRQLMDETADNHNLRSQLAAKDEEIANLSSTLAALSIALDKVGVRHSWLQGTADVVNQRAEAAEAENKRLREALENYATCCDGCTCGDGWNHDVARSALARPEGK